MRKLSKEDVERGAAEMFLPFYNAKTGRAYRIVSQRAPAKPDVRCEDASGAVLNLEVTMLQDKGYDKRLGRKGDAAVYMGRSNERDWRVKLAELERVKRGETPILDTVTSGVEILHNALERLRDKVQKQGYGTGVALLLLSTSGIDWDWDRLLGQVRQELPTLLSELNLTRHPFDKGIWIVAREAERVRVYALDEGEN